MQIFKTPGALKYSCSPNQKIHSWVFAPLESSLYFLLCFVFPDVIGVFLKRWPAATRLDGQGAESHCCGGALAQEE